MTRGAPDWSDIRKSGSVYRLDDMAELAVRLGSIVSYDRRGDVVFADDFEDVITRWNATAVGAGATVALDNARSRSGQYSVKMVTSATIGEQSLLGRSAGVTNTDTLGLEVSFSTSSTSIQVYLTLAVTVGGVEYTFAVRYDSAAKTLAYLDSTNAYVANATSILLIQGVGAFSQLKMVLSPSTGRYIRCLINGSVYDLSGIACFSQASAAAPVVQCYIGGAAAAAVAKTIWFDDAILTQNEL